MARRCTRRSLPNYFDMMSYHWNVRQNTVTWHWWMNGKNNVTSYTKWTHFNSTLAICLKFVFIEMLDKLITYIVWWYKTLYQVLPIATRSDTGSHNRLNLIQSLVPPHYVCNRYISWQSVLLVEDTRVLWENHRPDVCRWQAVSHNVVSSTSHPSIIQTRNISGKSKDWLAQNQNNMSAWSDMSTCRLLLQWANTMKTHLSMFV
jgi:hypothetical protein